MKALAEVRPTPEQLALFSRNRAGVEIIRGAAGSGKTTTALLKLRAAVGFHVSRIKRSGKNRPVKVLVLTFNRTLRGYIAELAGQQFEQDEDLTLEVSTFSAWAGGLVANPGVIDLDDARQVVEGFGANLGLDGDFINEEVAYVLGRFLPESLSDYLDVRRVGRGSLPRVDKSLREQIIAQVITPYLQYKKQENLVDWNDLAVDLAKNKRDSYDVVVVDEAQDFSANELRAVLNQLSAAHSATFVLDTTQRIYARSGFAWQEIGIIVRSDNSFSLTTNYRNTKQIARFAAGILDGLSPDADGSMPDFNNATKEGDKPLVLKGRFSSQLGFVVDYIQQHVNLETESVAFLHAKGGRWFKDLRQSLTDNGLPFVNISRRAEWPSGDENIALSTMHSAKGLEFDYVFIIGLNGEVVPIEESEDQTENETAIRLRRLVAMAVGRARKQVIIGYKPSDAPIVSQFFDSELCDIISV